ncbi:putative F-box protein At1g67390 [Miscanthus floridulus]|uniref:putative F-box protein At1g67390 n=1 Tax=Miscanthus floridulus TaxID=154761 RepID=UPI0034574AC6
MRVATRSKKRRPKEEELLTDQMNSLPKGVLSDIVSLLTTKDGAHTQVLSFRWCHLWRPAVHGVPAASEVSHILSSHPSPDHCFSISYSHYHSIFTTNLGGWLHSPTLNKLQEIQLDHIIWVPKSGVHRFLSTLRVATFSSCIFQDRNNASGTLHLLLLKQLSLVDIVILENYLHALLATCPAMQNLLL